MVDRSSRPHRMPRADPAAGGPQDRAPALEAAARAVEIAARLGLAASTVHRGAGPLPDQPARPRRPGHRRAGPPLRAPPPGLAAPRRCEEARQHPRRRRLALRRPPGRATATGPRPPASPATRHHNPKHGHRVRAHRARRPQPGRLRRDPRRRDRRHRHRRAATGRWPGSPPAASPSNGCCPTTARPTAPTPGATPAPSSGITPKRTRPYRPQTNGKIERFHRTLAAGWAFRRLYLSESATPKGPPAWLHEYNHHRPHTAIGKASPRSPA